VAYVRKDQAKLTKDEWDAFVDAVNDLRRRNADKPRYRDFVSVHVTAMSHKGMNWGVHTHMGELGRNFLAWHRLYLLRFEERLRDVGSDVAIPYWDPVGDPGIPRALNKKALLQKWEIRRDWSKDFLPSEKELDAVIERGKFKPFQQRLEFLHNSVHLAVGGDMRTSASPGDPIFWLHHANIDRLWAEWQKQHRGARPPNGAEHLKPPPMFGRAVSDVLRIKSLGYSYA
jgi:tyrosinase